jgi:peptidoglycan/LPS O-acetylase OafA/YrhL
MSGLPTPTFPPAHGPQKYFPLFDWLRGVLAMTVVVGHAGLVNLQWAYVAVQVFFALSGWLIGGMLLQMSGRDLPRFFYNRVARIWTPYFAALSLLIAVSLLKEPITNKWIEFVFYKMTFVYNLFGPPRLANERYEMPLDGTGNHFWSICFEEQFYLLAPILLVVLPGRIGRAIPTWIAFCALTPLISHYFEAPIASPSICLGVVSIILVRQYGDLHLTKPSRIVLAALLAASAYGLAAGYPSLAPLFAISVVLLLAVPGRHNAFGALVGGVSYPLYLNHWLGFFVANFALGPLGLRDSTFVHAVSIPAAVVISTCMYFMIDRPVLKYRSHYFSPARARVAMLFAYGTLVLGFAGALWFANYAPR